MNYFFSCFLGLLICCSAYSKPVQPIVVLLSIDGFSYEYLNKYKPPNILALANSGILAKLQPVYPSKTFPNHLSIITGSYPITHGIINNNFYNPILAEKYSLGAGENNAKWLTAEPFWTVAKQQGIKTAVYFWPESEALGKTPTYNIPFNKTDSNKARFDQIIKWLQLPLEQRPHFIATYFSTVDSAGHRYGPDSNELINTVKEIDLLIGNFVTQLSAIVAQEVNVIIVSDHGMLKKNRKKVVKPSMIFNQKNIDLIESKTLTVIRNDTQLYIYFTGEKADTIQPSKVLKSIKNNPHFNVLFQVYTKKGYPEHWQLNHANELVPDIIVEALPPATFVKENYDSKSANIGTHGYDPKNQKNLMGIFIASGPNIVKRTEIEPFENIHIFPFLSQVFSLETPTAIDGKSAVLAPYIINK